MDISTFFPSLEIASWGNDDIAQISLRFKGKSGAIVAQIDRIDPSGPDMAFDWKNAVSVSFKGDGQSFEVTLDELRDAFSFFIREIEDAINSINYDAEPDPFEGFFDGGTPEVGG